MENLRKRCNVKLVTNTRKLARLAARPTYISSKFFNNNLVAVHKTKTVLSPCCCSQIRIHSELLDRGGRRLYKDFYADKDKDNNSDYNYSGADPEGCERG